MRKTNWPKLLYIFCWSALVNGLLFSSGFVVENTSVQREALLSPVLHAIFRLCMFLLILILLYLIFQTLRRITNRSQRFGVIFLNFSLFLTVSMILFVLCSALLPGLQVCRVVTGVLTVLCLAILVPVLIFSDPHSPHLLSLRKNKSHTLWYANLFAIVFVGATFWIPNMWGIRWPAVQLPGDLLGYYGAQLSLTFITISVMSVLSDKSVVVYWENIAEAKLISPLFGSFASYTAYSITATVGAGISVLLGNHLAFAVFFALNIFILILLTLTMVDVYYGRDSKKKGLQKTLQRTAAAYRKTLSIQNMPKNTDLTVSLAANVAQYRENMLRLQHLLHRAMDDHDIPYISEVLTLYGQNMECFQSPEGHAIEKLLLQATETPWETILLSLDAYISEREAAQAFTADPFHNQSWCADSLLWKAFAENPQLREYLEHLPPKSELPDLLCWTVIHRMNALANDMIIALYKTRSRWYLCDVTLRDGQLSFRMNNKALLSAFKVYGSEPALQPELLCALCEILLLALPQLSDSMQASLSSCPILPLLEIPLNHIPDPTPEVAQLVKRWLSFRE